MENNKFLPSQAVAYGFRSWLDAIKLFFTIGAVVGCVLVVTTLLLLLINLNLARSLLTTFNKLKTAQALDATQDMAASVQEFMTLASQNLIALALSALVVWFVVSVLWLGYSALILEFHARGTSSVGQLFAWIARAPLFMVATLIYMIICALGLVLFVVPGVYMMIRLNLYPYCMVDRKLGPFAALGMSWRLTQGSEWQLFALLVVYHLVQFLSAALLLVVMPALALAYVYAYDKLKAL